MGTLERLIPRVGERIQRYQLLERIGSGGFGVVFRARQIGLDADVAVKVLRPRRSNQVRSQQIYERFEQEARLSKELEHPCAIKVRDYGWTKNKLPYLVSEFILGPDLDDVLAEGGISLPRTTHIARQILGCLAEAHHRGIVHRDLKPSNIKLVQIFGERDVVKVMDFGIAKVSSELGGIETQTGMGFGSPHYMAPEQAQGRRDLDGRADLYSLGLVIAECLTGKRVVQADDHYAAIYMNAGPEPLTFHPDVAGSPIFGVIERATRKDRDERFPHALAMRAALDAVGADGVWVPERNLHMYPPTAEIEPLPALQASLSPQTIEPRTPQLSATTTPVHFPEDVPTTPVNGLGDHLPVGDTGGIIEPARAPIPRWVLVTLVVSIVAMLLVFFLALVT